MLKGAPAAYYQAPVYGHSHYKKFWLKKMEAAKEEDFKASGFAVNFPSLELGSVPGTSRSPLTAVESRSDKEKSSCDISGSVNNEDESKEFSDGFFSADEKVCGFYEPVSGRSSADMSREESHGVNQAAFSSSGTRGSPRGGSRMCTECKTIKTPLWRNGPDGPKSLCNACGIRYKKLGKRLLEQSASPPSSPIAVGKQQVMMSKRKKDEGKPRHTRKKAKVSRRGAEAEDQGTSKAGDDQTSSESAAVMPWQEIERIRRGLLRYGKLRSMAKDEEEGAVLLMALSCGVASC
eukprot:TRINITY_DN2745_c0_g1_i1.p1 TRINITY_DN2745_c0_g1~~TRINITY_DN2745_c0_g1_i1.p1  ORF type:complete len:292 (-),score=29.12 TRINITY_DN2745_c0_g1_i1:314-1189(-)